METNRLTILDLEDDPGDVTLMHRQLEQALGNDVKFLSFPDFESGRKSLTNGSVDLIFLDYLLGAETGLEVLRKLRQCGDTPPVIMVTGRGDEQIAFRALANGAAAYLEKGGISPASLKQAIQLALEQRERRSETGARVEPRPRQQGQPRFSPAAPAPSARRSATVVEVATTARDVTTQPVPLVLLVEDVVAAWLPRAGERGIRLRSVMDHLPPEIYVEAELITHVLPLMLSQVLHASAPGTDVTVRVDESLRPLGLVVIAVVVAGADVGACREEDLSLPSPIRLGAQWVYQTAHDGAAKTSGRQCINLAFSVPIHHVTDEGSFRARLGASPDRI